MVLVMDVEEEDQKYQLKLERISLRDRSNALNLPDAEFKRLFRLNKRMFVHLVNELSPHMSHGERSTKLSIPIRVLTALRFFAHGSYQRCTGSNFFIAMGQQTVSETLTEVCNAFEQIAHRWIQFPTDVEQQQQNKLAFMQQFGFPGVIGCIDGTHVAILSPVEDEHLYMNRKRFHSKNVQIICKQNLEILNVNANFPGATHDSFIWSNSAINVFMRNNYYNNGDVNTWLLGDSGYPQEPWLHTPVANALPDSPEARYNEAHARARNCVERCIGVLKMRWRCILKERVLRYHPHKVGQIINSCCVLHNMCIREDLVLDDEEDDLPGNFDYNDPGERNVYANRNDLQEGLNRRRLVINSYFNHNL